MLGLVVDLQCRAFTHGCPSGLGRVHLLSISDMHRDGVGLGHADWNIIHMPAIHIFIHSSPTLLAPRLPLYTTPHYAILSSELKTLIPTPIQIQILIPILIPHHPIQITGRMAPQIRHIQIHALRPHKIPPRILQLHLPHQLRIPIRQDTTDITILKVGVWVIRVPRAELVGAGQDNDGDAVGAGGVGDEPAPRGGDEGAVGEEGVGAQDHLVDAGHQGEDGRVGDEDDGDAGGGEGSVEELGGEGVIVVVGVGGVAGDDGVHFVVVVRVGFGVDDSEFPFGGGFEEEALHGGGGGVG
jgi:hypothetical protein